MTQATSVEAWVAIQDQLPEARARVYGYVAQNPDRTAAELEHLTGDRHLNKRLSELQDTGAILVSGTRPCSISGHEALQWRIVDPRTASIIPYRPRRNHGPTPRQLRRFYDLFRSWAESPSQPAWNAVVQEYSSIRSEQ